MHYFASLASALHNVVSVELHPTKGKCLVARRATAAGQALFFEKPLASQQHAPNADVVSACEQCHRFTGSLEWQLSKLLTVLPSTCAAQRVPAAALERIIRQVSASVPPVPAAAQLAGEPAEPGVPCASGCGARYCSPACRDTALVHHHYLFCPSLDAPGGGRAHSDESGDDEGDEDEADGDDAMAEDGGSGSECEEAGGADGDDVNAAELFRMQGRWGEVVFPPPHAPPPPPLPPPSQIPAYGKVD